MASRKVGNAHLWSAVDNSKEEHDFSRGEFMKFETGECGRPARRRVRSRSRSDDQQVGLTPPTKTFTRTYLPSLIWAKAIVPNVVPWYITD